MEKLIIVSAWRNSSKKNSNQGVCYGIRIPKKHYYDLRKWEKIELDGYNICILRKVKTPFTEKCPEIRSKILDFYFNEEKILLDWKIRKPPLLELHFIRPNVWLLKYKKIEE